MAGRQARTEPTIEIRLVLDGGDPPSGRAEMAPEASDEPGAGVGGTAASVRFVGWLGLLSALNRLVRFRRPDEGGPGPPSSA